MEAHYELDDHVFISQFEAATLDPKLFSHEAHLRLAWIHIKRFGIETAVKHITTQILHYASLLGAHDKYNETVTVAAVRAVYHFMLKSESDNFKDFIAEFPRLKYNFKDLLAQHYDIDIFNLNIAKSSFLEPTLLPFD